MKKSVLLSAFTLLAFGAPAFAADDRPEVTIGDCHAADMPKSAYNACISRSEPTDNNSQQYPDDRQAGLSADGDRDANGQDNDRDESDGPVLDRNDSNGDDAQDDGDTGDRSDDGDRSDSADGDWGRGQTDGHDQSGSDSDRGSDDAQGDQGTSPDGDGGDFGDDTSGDGA